jgi:hypothetical protein
LRNLTEPSGLDHESIGSHFHFLLAENGASGIEEFKLPMSEDGSLETCGGGLTMSVVMSQIAGSQILDALNSYAVGS